MPALADPFEALGAVADQPAPVAPITSGDPFAALGSMDEGAYRKQLVDDPHFDPEQHAAAHPADEELAYQVNKEKQARPFWQRALEATTDEKMLGYGKSALHGVGNFLGGLVTAPVDTLNMAYYAAMGDPRYHTKHAEAVLAAQGVEQSLSGLSDNTVGRLADAQRTTADTDYPEDFDPKAEADFQEKIRRDRFMRGVQRTRNSMQLAQGVPLESGPTATLVKSGAINGTAGEVAGPEALKAAGAPPVDPELVAEKTAAADPSFFAMSRAGNVPGAGKLSGELTQGMGRALQLPAEGMAMLPGKLGKAATGTAVGAGVVLGETALHNPLLAAKIGLAAGAAKGLQKLGQVVEQQGAEAATGVPSELSQRVAKGRFDSARGLGGLDLKAEAGRVIGDAPAGALSTAIGMAPLGAVESGGDPEKFASGEVGALAFGGALSALHSSRPQLIEALRPTLRIEGVKTIDGNSEVGKQSLAYLNTLSEATRNTIFETMGALQGLNTKGAKGDEGQSHFYVLDPASYAQQLAKLHGQTAEGGGRGYFLDHEGNAYINGAENQNAGDMAHTMGHEGGHMVEAILRAAGEPGTKIWDGMMDSVSKGLIKNGKPTEDFQKFINTYNDAFDPTGETKALDPSDPKAVHEFLAEHAGRLFAGEGAASMALPKTILDRIESGMGNFAAKALGVGGKLGQTSELNQVESRQATQILRDVIGQVARLPRQEPPVGRPATAEAPDSQTAPAPAPDPISAAGINHAEVDAMKARAADDAENQLLRARGRRSVSPDTDATQRANARDNAANQIDQQVNDLVANLGGRQLQHPLHDAILINGMNAEDGGYSAWLNRKGTAKADQGSPERIVEEPHAGEEDPGTFAIQDDERAAIRSQGWTDQEINAMAPHQIEELAAKGVQNAQANGSPTASGATAVQSPPAPGVPGVEKAPVRPGVPETDQVDLAREAAKGTPAAAAIDTLDANRGKVVWIRSYASAKKEQAGFGEAERTKEIARQSADKRKAGAQGSLQDKPFIPTEIRVNAKGEPYVNGFDVDVMLSNLRHVVDFMREKGIANPIQGDVAIQKALGDYVWNHNHGFDGAGTKPLEQPGPDYRMPKPDQDAAPRPLDPNPEVAKRIADMLNLAVNSKPSEIGGAEADKAVALAKENQGFAAGDETNPFRQELVAKGFDIDRDLSKRSAFYGRLALDLAKGGVTTKPSNLALSVRPHGFDIDLTKAFEAGKPQFEAVAAGFMPKSQNRQLGENASGQKADEERMRSFWIDRSGKVIGSTSPQGHTEVAESQAGTDKEGMERDGWVRGVGEPNGDITIEMSGGPLTPGQSRKVKQMAEDRERKAFLDHGFRGTRQIHDFSDMARFMPKSPSMLRGLDPKADEEYSGSREDHAHNLARAIESTQNELARVGDAVRPERRDSEATAAAIRQGAIRQLDPAPLEAAFRDGKLGENRGRNEHDVFFDEESGRVIKLTKTPGVFGVVDVGTTGDSILPYLKRLKILNEHLDDDLHFEGVIEQGGQYKAVISQPLIKGRQATEPEIADYFKAKGWRKFGRASFFHPGLEMTMNDAEPVNVLVDGNGRVAPIDVIPKTDISERKQAQIEMLADGYEAQDKDRLSDENASKAAKDILAGIKFMPKGKTETPLQKAWRDTHEQENAIDPRTGRPTIINRGRLTPEQSEKASQALRDIHRGYDEAFKRAAGDDSDENVKRLADAIPRIELADLGLTRDPKATFGFRPSDPHDTIKYAGYGGESVTFVDGDVAYKIFHPQHNELVGIFHPGDPEIGIGIEGRVIQKLNGEWDMPFQGGTVGSMLEKLNVISRSGGIPTEVVGLTKEGALVVKQPRYPNSMTVEERARYRALMAKSPEDITPSEKKELDDLFDLGSKISPRDSDRRLAFQNSELRAQIEPLDEAALNSNKISEQGIDRVTVVDGVPYFIGDMTGGNFTIDNQGDYRVSDSVVGRIPDQLLREVPPLKRQVDALKTNEAANRSRVAFMPKGEKSYEDKTQETPSRGLGALRLGQQGDQQSESGKDAGGKEGNGSVGAAKPAPGIGGSEPVTFEHWSRVGGLDTLDPAKHGSGIPGAEAKRRVEDPERYQDRVYLGLPGYSKEPRLPDNKYSGTVDPSLIYDFKQDPLNLRTLAKAAHKEDPFVNPVTEYERLIKEHGYLGYHADNVAAIFHPIAASGHTGPEEFSKAAPDYYKRSPEMQRALREYVGNYDKIADDYFQQKPTTPEQVAKQNEIAKAYDAAKTDNLADPNVRRAYDALVDKLHDQYDTILKGLDIEPWTGKGQPYKNSAAMQEDMRANKHLYFFPTTPETFGSSDNFSKDHPMIQESGKETKDGYKLLNNDLLRAVHDAIAHGAFGVQFGPAGEEAAWRAHLATVNDPWARWALTTETRGQNSWVNFRDAYLRPDGTPKQKGDEGYVPPPQRPFADQKTDLLDPKFMLTGDRAVDEVVTNNPEFREAAGLPSTMRDKSGKFMPTAGPENSGNYDKIVDDKDAQFMPKASKRQQDRERGLQELDLGKNFTPQALSQQAVKRRVMNAGMKFPEAIQPVYRRENGKYILDENGKPAAETLNYDLGDTPLAKEAAKGIRGPEKRQEAIAGAYADKLEQEYKRVTDRPDIMAGADWYELARGNIKKHFKKDALLFSQLLGATSARTPARENFNQALDAYNQWKSGAFKGYKEKYLDLENRLENGEELTFPEDYTPAEGSKGQVGKTIEAGTPVTGLNFKEFLDQQGVLPRQANGMKFNANSLQVLRVLSGNWAEKLNAPKTIQFSSNLAGKAQVGADDPFGATADVWVGRLLRRLGNEGLTDKRWRIMPESESGVSDDDFEIAQKAYKKAADRIGMNPDALQGVLWFAEKETHAKRGWGRGGAGAEFSDFNTWLNKLETRGGQKVIAKEPDPQQSLF